MIKYPDKFDLVYDNDMGNDIDDAFAQAMAAQCHAAGRTRLLLTLSSNPNPWSVAAIDSINRYYGASDCSLGIYKGTVKAAMDMYTSEVSGKIQLPRERVCEGVAALRRTLYSAADNSIRVVATGFSSNLSTLLCSMAYHQGDGIPLNGIELVRRKVQFLSIMACDFSTGSDPSKEGEFNVVCDIPAMADVMERWPTDAYISDFTIGNRVLVDWSRLKVLLKDENPIKTGYVRYYECRSEQDKTPMLIGDRPSWDQTSMLFALEPDAGHFSVSEEGSVAISEKGQSVFRPSSGGRRYLLSFDTNHTPQTVNEVLFSRYYRETDS